MKRLSIIIVTYNSERDIFDCVASIKQWADIPLDEIELIVVDNSSDAPEPMFERLRQMWRDVIIIENNRNGGYGQGNNLGIQRSTAPLILIMNPDVRLYEPIFQKALAHFERDQRLGMLGMAQMLTETERGGKSFSPTWLMNGYLHVILYAVCNRRYWYIPSCMYIQGSCFFLRKSMFAEVGMFDAENFMYCEEEDIHYRMKQRFGSRCFGFDKTLHYIHLTMGREPSFEYEKRLLLTDMKLYEKKGISPRLIAKRYLQTNRLLLWRESLKSKDSATYKVLETFDKFIRELLQEKK